MCLQLSFQNSVSHGDIQKVVLLEKVHGKCSLVDISTCIHSYNDVVVVGPSTVVCYGKFEVFSFIELTPVGFNMINYHIYPWWIWLPVSKFINVGVISFWEFGQAEPSRWLSSCSDKLCGNVLFCDTPCTWHSLQDPFALAGVNVSHISCTCPPSLGVI